MWPWWGAAMFACMIVRMYIGWVQNWPAAGMGISLLFLVSFPAGILWEAVLDRTCFLSLQLFWLRMERRSCWRYQLYLSMCTWPCTRNIAYLTTKQPQSKPPTRLQQPWKLACRGPAPLIGIDKLQRQGSKLFLLESSSYPSGLGFQPYPRNNSHKTSFFSALRWR